MNPNEPKEDNFNNPPMDTIFKETSELIPLSYIDWSRVEKLEREQEYVVQPDKTIRFLLAVIRLQKQHLNEIQKQIRGKK